eukprot:gene16521-22552_t
MTSIEHDTIDEKSSWFPSLQPVVIVVFLLDIAVISVCNGLFVYIILHESVTNVRLAEAALAIIKLVVNEFLIPKVLSSRSQTLKSNDKITVRIYMFVINCFFIPCVLTAVINTNCFFYIITKPPIISSSYEYKVCNNFAVQDNDFLNIVKNQCLETASVQKEVSYYPAFTYTYQCSASLISNYSSVFVYQYMIGSFIFPVGKEILRKCFSNSWFDKAAFAVVTPFSRIINQLMVEELEEDEELENFIAKLFNALIIQVTFGALVPPLAVIICSSILFKMYYIQSIIQRNEKATQDPINHHQDLERGFAKVAKSFRHLYWILAPFCGTFYGFIIFDTLGDEVGYLKALWAPIVFSLIPFVIHVIAITYMKLFIKMKRKDLIRTMKNTKVIKVFK